MQQPPLQHVYRMQRGDSAPPRRTAQPADPPASAASLRTDALDYHLAAERIATHPVEPRDSARMLVLWRGDQSRLEHRQVRDLPEYLRTGDALVFNNTAVAPARLEMRRATGGRVEGLFLQEAPAQADHAVERDGETCWLVMLRSGGRIAIGERLALLDREDRATDLALRVVDHSQDQWTAALEGAADTMAALDRVGRTPLPPYILKARHEHHESYPDDDDRRWYQTVYADALRRQSVAAPTAGLHFTPELLARIEAMGVQRINITLHVGPGTFKPVTAATLDQHRMHAEQFEVSDAALRKLRQTRSAHGGHDVDNRERAPANQSLATALSNDAPGRIIAVGTTSVRALESLPTDALSPHSQICGPVRESTDLLIAPVPQHAFGNLDGMLTNFHLPRSTLLALVAAMVGLERLLAVYREAIERGYRFYSYGDAMLILP